MRNLSFTILGAAFLLLIQSAAGQQSAVTPASTNVVITTLNAVAVPAETNKATVLTNAPPVIPPAAELLTIDVDGVKLEFVLIHPGEFLMGSLLKNGIQHKVTITKPYYIGKYEVTQEQWLAVMRNNPSNFNDPTGPVENVSWEDCEKFLMKLSDKAASRKFSLPTEAQWEYACRAGSTSEYCYGDDATDLDSYAWYMKNAIRSTHPVGEKRPNAWGLYDMHGNVWEWCADWFGDYLGTDETDPTGAESGSMRVLRGGSWYNYAPSCRSADRGFYYPSTRNSYSGFRVVTEVR